MKRLIKIYLHNTLRFALDDKEKQTGNTQISGNFYRRIEKLRTRKTMGKSKINVDGKILNYYLFANKEKIEILHLIIVYCMK